MTVSLAANVVANQIMKRLPDVAVEASGTSILVKSDYLFTVARFLKNDPSFDFNYLVSITAIDYDEYFEAVYQLTSLEHNHSLFLKARCYDKHNPVLPSVVSLWRGADFQEREIYDLMGIQFKGHPNLKHIFLWEGFKGYPLRKDYL